MGDFNLLWSSIVRSSIWVTSSKETRLVWITILALKDRDGIVRSSLIGLADAAKVTKQECIDSLEELMSPDPDDTSGVEDGRRLRKIDGGWQVVNNERYRTARDIQREEWRIRQAECRARADGGGAIQPVELPPGFPADEKAAVAGAMGVGCPEVFVVASWNQAMGRGGRDSKDVPIRSWPKYLAACWTYQRSREAEQERRAGRNGGVVSSSDGRPAKKPSEPIDLATYVTRENLHPERDLPSYEP
jgi:hypothetical protein